MLRDLTMEDQETFCIDLLCNLAILEEVWNTVLCSSLFSVLSNYISDVFGI